MTFGRVHFKMAVGSDPDYSLDFLLNQTPSLTEVCEYAKTADWYRLGVLLQLDSVDLENIRKFPLESEKLTRIYDIWLNTKGETATRQELLTALRSEFVGLNQIALKYEKYLKERVSCYKTIIRLLFRQIILHTIYSTNCKIARCNK